MHRVCVWAQVMQLYSLPGCLSHFHADLHQQYLLQAVFVHLIILHSETAHSVWMADEASKALENWAKKYILSHEHIRAVHAEERSAATKKPRSESEHADCISVLVEKLEDQGWFLPRIALKHNI